MLFHNFDRFLTVYEGRFEKEYSHSRPVVKEVVERYLDCGNPRSGFARIRCPECHSEQLLTFSCKTRGFCPSCHAKRREEWGQWIREALLLDVPHRQVVLTIPKALQIFFKFRRRLLGELSRAAVKALSVYLEALAGERLIPGIIVARPMTGLTASPIPSRASAIRSARWNSRSIARFTTGSWSSWASTNRLPPRYLGQAPEIRRADG